MYYLPPVVCRRDSCIIYVRFVYLQLFVGGLMYYLRSVRLYLQLFVGGLMYYLRSSLPPVVCRRAHVLFTLLVFVFTSSCL